MIFNDDQLLQYVHFIDKKRFRKVKDGMQEYHQYGYQVVYYSNKRNHNKIFSAQKCGLEEAKELAIDYIRFLIDNFPPLRYRKSTDGNSRPIIFETKMRNKGCDIIYHYVGVDWYVNNTLKSKLYRIYNEKNKRLLISKAEIFAKSKSIELGWCGEFKYSKRKMVNFKTV